jgi:serine phosphatase RsbU (regulator of sigma subunit)
MQEAASPGHHIIVRLGAVSIQAQAHHRASPDILAAMQTGAGRPDGRASLGAETIVVGTATRDDVVVYVSEYLSDIQRAVRDVLVWRILTILVVGVVIGIIFNVLVHRLLMRPLRGMVQTVRQFSQGRLAARMPPANTVELGFLADEFDLMAGALEASNAEHRAQMAKARRIQDNLRPELGKTQGVRLACLFQPASEVAGDYYDVAPLSDGALLFCVADVTGHGVPAAMGAAMLKSLLQVATERESQPERVLRLLNAAFRRVSLDEDFATMTLVRWDRPNRMLAFASAGHGMAYLLRKAGGIETFDSTGPALGFVVPGRWATHRTSVASGDRLIIVTDGVTETASADGDFFGRERLLALLEQSRGEPVDVLSSQLAAALASYRGSAPQRDDITLLAAKF